MSPVVQVAIVNVGRSIVFALLAVGIAILHASNPTLPSAVAWVLMAIAAIWRLPGHHKLVAKGDA